MDWLAYERLILRKLNLEEEMLKAFRLKSLDELEGAYFLGMVCRLGAQANYHFALRSTSPLLSAASSTTKRLES
ncbi:TPA: hypothetical protein ACKP1S_004892 [Pseudomonas aeruginosa]